MLPQPPENGRPILVPGQLKVHHSYHPSPMKDATVLRMDQEGTINFHTFGGRTNLEDAALQMAAALITADAIAEGQNPIHSSNDDLAVRAVGVAKAVMDEARRCDVLIPDSPAAQTAVEERAAELTSRGVEKQQRTADREEAVRQQAARQRKIREAAPTVVDSPIASDDRL